tara:strand:- start:497 stop:1615 length:1119 start_codon:yes stop_codon:yes gene_type:complete
MDPDVFEEMKPYFMEHFGNASSAHKYGWRAQIAVEQARQQVADLLGVLPVEIVFTSGATESLNSIFYSLKRALFGSVRVHMTPIEHPALVRSAHEHSGEDWKFCDLETDSTGTILLDDLETVLKGDGHSILACHLAHSELGTLQPLFEISKRIKKTEALWVADASQWVGKVPLDVKRLGIDYLGFSGHKIYGPKGVGVTYVSKDRMKVLHSMIVGGSQQDGARSGTLNVPGIVGIGKACEIARYRMSKDEEYCLEIMNQIIHAVSKNFPRIQFLGNMDHRLPNHLCLWVPEVSSSWILSQMKNFGISTGSACSLGYSPTWKYLEKFGYPKGIENQVFRLGWGRMTTRAEIDYFLSEFFEVLRSHPFHQELEQ